MKPSLLSLFLFLLHLHCFKVTIFSFCVREFCRFVCFPKINITLSLTHSHLQSFLSSGEREKGKSKAMEKEKEIFSHRCSSAWSLRHSQNNVGFCSSFFCWWQTCWWKEEEMYAGKKKMSLLFTPSFFFVFSGLQCRGKIECWSRKFAS